MGFTKKSKKTAVHFSHKSNHVSGPSKQKLVKPEVEDTASLGWSDTSETGNTAVGNKDQMFQRFCSLYNDLLRLKKLRSIWSAAQENLEDAITLADRLFWKPQPSTSFGDATLPTASKLTDCWLENESVSNFSESEHTEMLKPCCLYRKQKAEIFKPSCQSPPVLNAPAVNAKKPFEQPGSWVATVLCKHEASAKDPGTCKTAQKITKGGSPATAPTTKSTKLVDRAGSLCDFPSLEEACGGVARQNLTGKPNEDSFSDATKPPVLTREVPSATHRAVSAWTPKKQRTTAHYEEANYNHLSERKGDFLCWCFPDIASETIDFYLVAYKMKLRDTVAVLLEDHKDKLNNVLRHRIKLSQASAVPRESSKTVDCVRPWTVPEDILLIPGMAATLAAMSSGKDPVTVFAAYETKQTILKWVTDELCHCFLNSDKGIIKDVVSIHYENLIQTLAASQSHALTTPYFMPQQDFLVQLVDLLQQAWTSLCDILVDASASAHFSVEQESRNACGKKEKEQNIVLDTILATFDPTVDWVNECSDASCTESWDLRSAGSLQQTRSLTVNPKNCADFDLPLVPTPRYTGKWHTTETNRAFASYQAQYFALLRLRNLQLRNAALASSCSSWNIALKASSEGRTLNFRAQEARRNAAEAIFKSHNHGWTMVQTPDASDAPLNGCTSSVFVPTLLPIDTTFSKNKAWQQFLQDGYYAVMDLHRLHVDEALEFFETTVDFLKRRLENKTHGKNGCDQATLVLMHVITVRVMLQKGNRA